MFEYLINLLFNLFMIYICFEIALNVGEPAAELYLIKQEIKEINNSNNFDNKECILFCFDNYLPCNNKIMIPVNDFNYNIFKDIIEYSKAINNNVIYVNKEIIQYEIHINEHKAKCWVSFHNCQLFENDYYGDIQKYLNKLKQEDLKNNINNF